MSELHFLREVLAVFIRHGSPEKQKESDVYGHIENEICYRNWLL